MTGWHFHRIRKFTSAVVIALAALMAFTACGTSSTQTGSKSPIVIGASLSTSGDFADDGKAFQQGYELWADQVNAHGGLLGRQVKLDIVADNSTPDQVTTNYQKLITVDKVDLTIGPYSSLLTKPVGYHRPLRVCSTRRRWRRPFRFQSRHQGHLRRLCPC